VPSFEPQNVEQEISNIEVPLHPSAVPCSLFDIYLFKGWNAMIPEGYKPVINS